MFSMYESFIYECDVFIATNKNIIVHEVTDYAIKLIFSVSNEHYEEILGGRMRCWGWHSKNIK